MSDIKELKDDELEKVSGGENSTSNNTNSPVIGYLYRLLVSDHIYIKINNYTAFNVSFISGSMQGDGKVHKQPRGGTIAMNIFNNSYDVSNPLTSEYWVE